MGVARGRPLLSTWLDVVLSDDESFMQGAPGAEGTFARPAHTYTGHSDAIRNLLVLEPHNPLRPLPALASPCPCLPAPEAQLSVRWFNFVSFICSCARFTPHCPGFQGCRLAVTTAGFTILFGSSRARAMVRS